MYIERLNFVTHSNRIGTHSRYVNKCVFFSLVRGGLFTSVNSSKLIVFKLFLGAVLNEKVYFWSKIIRLFSVDKIDVCLGDQIIERFEVRRKWRLEKEKEIINKQKPKFQREQNKQQRIKSAIQGKYIFIFIYYIYLFWTFYSPLWREIQKLKRI